MVYTSTQALQNSLPNRSPSQRPRSLSLSEYQPLTFDREATAAAYRAQLHQPVSSSTATSTSTSHWPVTDSSYSANSHDTNLTGLTSLTAPSSTISLSHYLRPGDNPHHKPGDGSNPIDVPPGSGPFFGANNFAGVGAGHSLTPPQSPIHKAAQQVQAHRTSLNLGQGQVQEPGGSLQDDQIPEINGLGISDGRNRYEQSQGQGQGQAQGQGRTAPELPRRPSVLPDSTYRPEYEGGSSRINGMDISGQAQTVNGVGDAQTRQRQRSGSYTAIQRSPPPSWLHSHDDPTPTHGPSGYAPGSAAATIGSNGYQQDSGIGGEAADGWESDPGYPRYVGGRSGGRRGLPAVPTNVPAPQPPAWEPDYKAHIPPGLTQSSVEHAYAQLSAPPPGLPPRRNPQQQQRYGQSSSSVMPQISNAASAYGQEVPVTPMAGPSHAPMQEERPVGNVVPGDSQSFPPTQNGSSAYTANPPPGAPSFPPDPNAPPAPYVPKPRRPAEESVTLKAEGRTPIWSTHFLDPCLRNPLISIPQSVANMTNKAMSASVGGQMDGMAKMAKEWFVPPDARFSADKGAIELGLGVIDCGGRDGEEGWGREKGRRRARVEVLGRIGGIKVDLIEIDENRQVDLKIDTKAGDVLVLLPDNFFGAINITTPGPDPHFCRNMSSTMSPLSHPYETFYAAFVAPPSIIPTHLLQPDGRSANPKAKQNTGGKRQRWVPEFLRSSDDFLGVLAHTSGDWSKINIVLASGKGRIVLGYRETEDEEEVKGLRLRVGMQGQDKKKRWWR